MSTSGELTSRKRIKSLLRVVVFGFSIVLSVSNPTAMCAGANGIYPSEFNFKCTLVIFLVKIDFDVKTLFGTRPCQYSGQQIAAVIGSLSTDRIF